MRNFSTRLKNRDYPATTVEKHLSEVIFPDRKKALEQRNKNVRKKILPFVTQYHPALPNLKNILMGKWHLIQNQPYLRNIFNAVLSEFVFFFFGHEDVSKGYGHFRVHGYSMGLKTSFLVVSD